MLERNIQKLTKKIGLFCVALSIFAGFCYAEEYRWTRNDDSEENSDWSATSNWKYYSEILSGWEPIGSDWPGSTDGKAPDVYFMTENHAAYAKITEDFSYPLNNLFINYYYNSKENSGDALVTIDLNGHTIETTNLILGTALSGKTKTQLYIKNSAGTSCSLKVTNLYIPDGFEHFIELDEGVKLEIENFKLGESSISEDNGTDGAEVVLKGSGTISTKGFDFPDNGKTYSITIESPSTFEITGNGRDSNGTYWASGGSSEFSWLGSGTLKIPKSGGCVEYDNIIVDYSRFSGTIEESCDVSYYTAKIDSIQKTSSSYSANLTLTRKETGGTATIKYPYKATFSHPAGDSLGKVTVKKSDGTEYDTISGDVSLDDGKYFSVPTGTNDLKYTVESSDFNVGDDYKITIYTPDGAFELLTFTVRNKTLLWNGSFSSSWEENQNWVGAEDITDFSSLSEYDVVIPGGKPNNPEISNATQVSSLLLQNGSKLHTSSDFSAKKLVVEENATFSIANSNFSAEELNVAENATFSLTDSNLEVTKNDGLSVLGTLSVAAQNNSATVKVASGYVPTIKNLLTTGISNGGVVFDGSFKFENATIKGAAQFKNNNEFNSFVLDSSSYVQTVSVLFASGTTQTFASSSTPKFIGNSKENPLLLSTIEGSGSWNAVFSFSVQDSDFEHVQVESVRSVDSNGNAKNLSLEWNPESVCEKTFCSTENWFLTAFTWNGSVSSSWLDSQNWTIKTLTGTTKKASHYPPFTTGTLGTKGTSEIIFPFSAVNNLDLQNGLNLPSSETVTELYLNSVQVESGAKILLGNCKVKVASFTNDGTVALYGTQENPVSVTEGGTITHTENSTIEYTKKDDSTVLESLTLFAKKDDSLNQKVFYNLIFDGAVNLLETEDSVLVKQNLLIQNENLDFKTKTPFFVTGTTQILSSNDVFFESGSINSQDAGSFTGTVYLKKANDVKIFAKSESTLSIKAGSLSSLGEAACNSIQIGSEDSFDFTTELSGTFKTKQEQSYYPAVKTDTTLNFVCGESSNAEAVSFYNTVDSKNISDTELKTSLIVGTEEIKSNLYAANSIGLSSALKSVVVHGNTSLINLSGDLDVLSEKEQTYYGTVRWNSTGGNIKSNSENVIFYDSIELGKADSDGNFAVSCGNEKSVLFKNNVISSDSSGQNVLNINGTLFIGDECEISLDTLKTKNFFVSALDSSNSPKNVQLNCDVSCDGSFALLNGTLTIAENFSVTKDIVLLNGTTSEMYADSGSGSAGFSGVTGLFAYNSLFRDGTYFAKGNLESFPVALTDGTAISDSVFNSSVILGLGGIGGITISCFNFYANGTDLLANSTWNLKVSPNDNATNSFAELYNAKIKNCTVSAKNGSGTAYLSAAERCEDESGNSGIYFSRPEFDEANTYTVFDNVIHVAFVDSITKNAIRIENSNNEISRAISNIKLSSNSSASSLVSFEGTFTDQDCTESTDGKGDLYEFYLKAPDSCKWNTDATGTSPGNEQSTNENGIHCDSVPLIDVPKALSNVFAVLLDEHKNRMTHLSVQNGGSSFTKVSDKTSPRLVFVRTGQEVHQSSDGTIESQKPYDSHNFIEFQYSEPVNIASFLLANQNEDENVNVRVTNSFGKTSSNSNAGFSCAGLASFANGSLLCGENGTESGLVHSLYRYFSTSALDSPVFQTHRIRLSVAGFTDSSITENSSEFRKWNGYIDSSEIPSGAVTVLSSSATDSFITDSVGNKIDFQGTAGHPLKDVVVDSSLSGLYGIWDTSSPVFAPYVAVNGQSSSYYEVIGAGESGAVTLNRVEFHVHDNEVGFTEGAYWFSRVGWGTASASLFTTDSYGADIFGGSRPFSSGEEKTSGGLRYSSLYDKAKYFSYKINGSGEDKNFSNEHISTGAKSSVFIPLTGAKRSTGTEDSLYFSINLSETSLPLRTTFSVSFDKNAFITDLAGNRLKSASVTSIDRMPPSFYISAAKVIRNSSDSSANKILVVFNKKLNLSELPLVISSSGEEKLYSIADSLRFIQIDSSGNAQVVSDLYIEQSSFTDIFSENDSYTGIVFTLNRTISLEDILSYHLQCYSPQENAFDDPLTGISNVSVTSVQDIYGNFMAHGQSHAVSDFAVNAVDPVLAYDSRLSSLSSVDLQTVDSDYTVRDWNEEQQNYGTLLSDSELNFIVKVNESSAELTSALGMYLSSNPDSQSVSDEINKNLSLPLRIWLPSVAGVFDSSLSSFTGEKSVLPIESLALKTNDSSNKESPVNKEESVFTFGISKESVSSCGFKAGDQVSFLFSLHGLDGNPLSVCHAPEYNEVTGIYDISNKQPIFALRLKNEQDLTSLDLWSIRLKEMVRQRGGVTILNNVINVSKGEKTQIQVILKDEGVLNVAVMTLDGNIVQYLQRGKASAGEKQYFWNGTNKAGKKVARGLYFVRVFGSGIDETRKVMVVKD